jgi:hypothetical protein
LGQKINRKDAKNAKFLKYIFSLRSLRLGGLIIPVWFRLGSEAALAGLGIRK